MKGYKTFLLEMLPKTVVLAGEFPGSISSYVDRDFEFKMTKNEWIEVARIMLEEEVIVRPMPSMTGKIFYYGIFTADFTPQMLLVFGKQHLPKKTKISMKSIFKCYIKTDRNELRHRRAGIAWDIKNKYSDYDV